MNPIDVIVRAKELDTVFVVVIALVVLLGVLVYNGIMIFRRRAAEGNDISTRDVFNFLLNTFFHYVLILLFTLLVLVLIYLFKWAVEYLAYIVTKRLIPFIEKVFEQLIYSET
jgi:hypothetical protein